ncbi:uncharacterized protein LOC143218775 [Lasioglossum baleicum]|uniref:uncharacterized protein LOC143218775 n=1 Tax=Lasioglossum baleicum TaxID=434251 RepID=UPI003FCC364F
MSINVTVNGNPLNIRQGRMALSDLDQIKKNERDRRRRLRLEQVRQQSKEISDRLLDRVKNITKQEQKKLESNDNLSSRQLFNEKIMEIQQKYQEDMADIGLAHLSAMLEPDHDQIVQEQERKNKLAASKRGKEAVKQIHEKQQKESAEQQHQNRLRQVRELENLRSTLVAKLPHVTQPEADVTMKEIDEGNKHRKSAKKKTRKQCFKKSPGKVTKSYTRIVSSDLKTQQKVKRQQILQRDPTKYIVRSEEQSVATSATIPSALKSTTTTSNAEHDQIPEEATPTSAAASAEVDKTLRYNPQDYVQPASASTSSSESDSSSSLSNNCSCLPTNTEQSKCIRTPKQKVNSSANDKVQLYDHSKHQSNVYNKPVGVVEKIHAWTEPSAIDLAQEIEKSEAAKSHVMESRKATAQKRGEDAVLREKVRRDYQTLLQNLNHLAVEERKLKANQAEHYQNDVHILQERRKMLKDQHKKKLNRALETLLPEECTVQCPSYPIERQITLLPKEKEKDVDVKAVWEDQCCVSEHSDSRAVQSRRKEPETSREEQILDMLKKVEKQKQLLLKEFGADLPSDIFNATMKPLFEKDKSIQAESTMHQTSPIQQRPLSPEIKVISAPCCSENSQRDKTETKKSSSVKKVEIAVQTTTETKHDVVQDKSIQVEIAHEKGNEAKTSNDDVDKVSRHYPIEPKITVITPEGDNNDTSSTFANTLNDTDNQNFELIAKKQKHKKVTPRKEKQKSLASVSRTSSFTKKLPKTLSSRSRLHGLKKPSSSTTSTPNERIKIYVNRTGFNIELNPAQTPEVAVDASTQSSQMRSTGVQHPTNTKSYSVRSQSTQIKMRDISDSSTSFASLAPMKPRNILEALSNNISVLEMLDSSTNESMKLLRRDITPVSTPETPSPRTMAMPSNVNHAARRSRMLRYTSIDSQTNDSSILSSKTNQPMTTDSSGFQQRERLPQHMRKHSPKQTVSSNGACSCENPECKFMDAKYHHVRDYALKNCPEILQKYEDLQTMCTERIVSLTNLIEKVRNDQKGVELSIINPADETSLMQLPPQQSTNLQSVRDLVENIEAIHKQLAKTLAESQNIIKNKTVSTQDSNQLDEANVETQTNEDVQKIASPYVASKVDEERVKAKPRIISDKRVSIQLDKYCVQQRSKRLEQVTQDDNSRHTSKLRDEEMIETLSQEILEQSKSLKNNLLATKERIDSSVGHTLQTDVVDSKSDYPLSSTRNETNAQVHSSKEVTETRDFVPLLADIPKLSKLVDTSLQTNGRSKPPVSLLSGPYRTEIGSSLHELSTIMEFDTPDTVNKSQSNVKSPASVKKIAESRTTKVVIDPTEHVAGSVNTHDRQQFTKSYDPSTSMLLSEVAKHSVQTAATRFNSPTGSKTVISRTEGKETINKKLQCNTESKGLSPKEQFQPAMHSTGININGENKNNDRITSTSSNSFSGLSGISQIASTPSSELLKYASSPEEMEIALKKLGLGWAITTLKKTREASALSSSSASDDRTPINTGKRISPVKKQFESNYALPDFSDVSSISVKEASKSTEHAVLLKGRTSTPLHSKLHDSNSNSAITNTSSTNVSENLQEPSEGLIIPDIALTSSKTNIKRLENL